MKENKLLIVILLGLLVGCTNEDTEIPKQKTISHKIELTANADKPSSRVGFDPSGAFYWSNGDHIGVSSVDAPTTFTQLTLSQGEGTGTATFEGTVAGDLGSYAVYPYHTDHQLNGSNLTYHFPESYNYGSNVDKDFHSTTKGHGNSFNAPMWGSINETKVSFKHLGGVFCIKLTTMPTGLYLNNTLKIQADQRLTGNYTSDLSASTPILTVDKGNEGKKEVTFTFILVTPKEQGVFYLPVPTGNYTNVKLILNDVEKKVIPTLTVERAHLITITDIVTVTSMEDAQNQLNNANNNAIVIDNKTKSESSNLELIPTTNSSPTSITFKGEAKDITIQENADKKDQVNQSVKLNMNGKQSGNLTIDLPQSTVQLSSPGTTTTFTNVTATTSPYTLNIHQGVEITNLDIKKGNVKVYAGAKITNIIKSSIEECTLFVQEGAIVPETLPTGINKVSDINAVSNLIVQKTSPIHAEIFLNPRDNYIMSPDEFFNYGICYSTTKETPTIEDEKIENLRVPESYGEGKGEPWVTNYILYGQPEQTIYYRSFMKYTEKATVMYSDVKTCTLSALSLDTTEEVDLGLSVIWRNWNLGADAPEKEGNLYRWGETTDFTSSSGDYPFSLIPDKVDPNNTLTTENDAAHKVTEGKYRMPTRTEINELKDRCVWGNLTYKGVQGRLVVGPNLKYIFLPKHHSESVKDNPAGYYLVYWSSVYDPDSKPDKQAYCIFDGEVRFSSIQTKNGLSIETLWPVHKAYMIRPVRNK